ncbi:MAG TPA: hypothetical protein VH877_00995 [Polyangia bacterium]|jgi:hypothetical protein|nr:hypothetical protein [Polyangia bacterium]
MATRKLPLIESGYSVFLYDGSDSFGAVRRLILSSDGGAPVLEVNIENAGDFRIPLDAVEKVASQRVVIRWECLPPEVQEAIRHTLDREDYPPPGGEVDLVQRAPDEPDEDDASRYDAPALASPPGELPGRDAGSFGAPPSISGRHH